MPFFLRHKINNNNARKLKKGNKKPKRSKVNNRNDKFRKSEDEEILSDDLEEDEEQDELIDDNEQNKKRKVDSFDDINEEDEEDENETAQEKRIRLAKKYLNELEQSEMFDPQAESEDEQDYQVHRSNMISTHLKESVLEKLGKLHRSVADHCKIDTGQGESSVVILKNGHRKCITAMAVSQDGLFVFTGSKDCNIVKWDFKTGRRMRTIYGNHRENADSFKGHTGAVMALAISTDSKFLASGCAGKLIHIWSPHTLAHIHAFKGHRAPITGLVFRRSFHQLFSCSEDRMVKVWNLDEMAYVDSLLGHHDTITSIDSFVRERCLTAGGRDGTIRLWKIVEESNLIFLTGNSATIDCVRMVDESHFLSASDDGSISLWSISKKKPIYTVKSNGHKPDHWITSMASFKNTDLFVSGSHDGQIIFWKIKPEFKGIERLFHYEVDGFVNALEFSQDGRWLVAAISSEHRLGRWFEPIRKARNVIHLIPLTALAAIN